MRLVNKIEDHVKYEPWTVKCERRLKKFTCRESRIRFLTEVCLYCDASLVEDINEVCNKELDNEI